MLIVPNPVVAITKSGQWKWALHNKNHPEYSAIFDVIERHSDGIDFILIGTSGRSPLYNFRMKKEVVAWDIPDNGLIGYLTYMIQLFRIFIQNRPQLIIMLGTGALIPTIFFSFISFKTKYVPIFVGGYGYYGKKTLSKILNFAQLNLTVLSLRASTIKMPRAFALSKFIRDKISKLAPNLKGKIALISYPISPIFSPKKQIEAEIKSTPTILTVAAIDPRKGLDILIKAIKLIPIEWRPNLIINGPIRDNQYMQRLIAMVSNNGLSKWIKFNRSINYDNLPSLYQSATLFVLPTREDALGVVVLEALHCGLPVIATSVGGLTDMIENGKNGILIKPDDPSDLANAIMLLLRDNELRLFLTKNSLKTLKNQYYNRLTLRQAFERSVAYSAAVN